MIVILKDYHNPQKEKFTSLFKDTEIPDKVQIQIEDDIDIEEGKTYLVFLKNDTTYSTQTGYGMIGFAGGLREAKTKQGDNSNTQVFNNFTKQWENLTDVIN